MLEIESNIEALKAMGYVVLRMTPTMWRARGPFGCIDLWLMNHLYRQQYASGRAEPYDNLFDLVRKEVVPFETRTDEEFGLYLQWKDGLTALTVRYLHIFFTYV